MSSKGLRTTSSSLSVSADCKKGRRQAEEEKMGPKIDKLMVVTWSGDDYYYYLFTIIVILPLLL